MSRHRAPPRASRGCAVEAAIPGGAGPGTDGCRDRGVGAGVLAARVPRATGDARGRAEAVAARAAARGFAVFHPNYRGSTGRGVEFAKLSQGDPAGQEFDDLVDAVDPPLIILHGKDDPRVDPGQSREMYRHLKLRGEAPVRLVLYPGEGHGNRKACTRLDYNLRLM